MDFDTLLDQITARVAEKIAEIESEESAERARNVESTESAKSSKRTEGAKSTASAGSSELPAAVEKEAAKKETVNKKEWEITKRVVTEKDVKEACRAGADCLLTGPRTIVTDLAKDRAQVAGLSIIKR